MPNRSDLSIRLALALKKIPKNDREAFVHKDWKISETAQQSIAALLADEQACYNFTLKPVAAPNTPGPRRHPGVFRNLSRSVRGRLKPVLKRMETHADPGRLQA